MAFLMELRAGTEYTGFYIDASNRTNCAFLPEKFWFYRSIHVLQFYMVLFEDGFHLLVFPGCVLDFPLYLRKHTEEFTLRFCALGNAL